MKHQNVLFLSVYVVQLGQVDNLILLDMKASRRDVLLLSSTFSFAPSPFLHMTKTATTSCTKQRVGDASISGVSSSNKNLDDCMLGFQYNSAWRGTRLPILDLETAAGSSNVLLDNKNQRVFTMGQWPDVALRHAAAWVEDQYFGTQILNQVVDALIETARFHKAVGLAAQQCGIDASVVYLELPALGLSSRTRQPSQSFDNHRRFVVWINPVIVGRSPEVDMKIWTEYCLVLPPTFRATVARDAWVDVEYSTVHNGKERRVMRVYGETARAAQHELDHDRGILTLDHIDLDEMENDVMRSIERDGHAERQRLAFAR